MTNELTVRVERPVIPAMRWNKDEVQKNLDELLAAYTGRVYTPEAVKDAKADRAAVNKWEKQLGETPCVPPRSSTPSRWMRFPRASRRCRRSASRCLVPLTRR